MTTSTLQRWLLPHFDVGNPATNVIPSKAALKFNIRYSTEQDV